VYGDIVSTIVILALAMTQVGQGMAPGPLQRMTQALAMARSYRIIVVATNTAAKSVISETITVVHRGGRVAYRRSVTDVENGEVLPQTVDTIDDGRQFCVRLPLTERWSCTRSTPVTHVDLARMARNPDLVGLHWRALAARVIDGQRCEGWSTAWHGASPIWGSSLEGLVAEVRLWLAAGSGRPVQIDAALAVSFTTSSGQGAIAHISEQATWSNWNSSTLHVPVVHQ
jgi:hypothetical protein